MELQSSFQEFHHLAMALERNNYLLDNLRRERFLRLNAESELDKALKEIRELRFVNRSLLVQRHFTTTSNG